MAIIPLGASTYLLGDVTDTRFKLDDALAVAGDAYRDTARFETMREQAERELTEARVRAEKLAKLKRFVRLELADTLRDVAQKTVRADELLLSQEVNMRTYQHQKEALSGIARFLSAYESPVTNRGILGWSLRRLSGESLGERIEASQRDAAIARVHQSIVERLLVSRDVDAISRSALHAAAGDRADDGLRLKAELTRLQDGYLDALKDLDRASATREASEYQLRKIEQIVAAVEADILSMQSELARIDGRLRAKVERELVQKGLREDRPDRFTAHGPVTKGEFQMPVEGRISAGFYDAHYKQVFGVPHKGMDIVVPHGSPVHSAADGIVYLVRKGGATGYTYVLIGHRDGYATLYGHLSKVSVQAGERVGKGEQIGESGATPGTDGAGPMTTGPHLHFEVIHNGEHIDPKAVLP